MATKKRRLLITLPADVDIALKRFSDVTGATQSGFVVDCLRQNVQTLNALCDAVEAANAGDMDAYERLVRESLETALKPLDDLEKRD